MYDYDASLEWNKRRLRSLNKQIDDLEYSIERAEEELRRKVEDAELLVKQIREEEWGMRNV